MTLPTTIKRGFVRAKVIDCCDGAQRFKQIEYMIMEYPDKRKVFQLVGGPTGYEGFYIEKDTLLDYANPKVKCWVACMGTNHVYDRMEIPREEMEKALGGI